MPTPLTERERQGLDDGPENLSLTLREGGRHISQALSREQFTKLRHGWSSHAPERRDAATPPRCTAPFPRPGPPTPALPKRSGGRADSQTVPIPHPCATPDTGAPVPAAPE